MRQPTCSLLSLSFLLPPQRVSHSARLPSLLRPPLYSCLNAHARHLSASRRLAARSTAVVHGKASAALEKRIDAIPLERYRNFCIVAHVVGSWTAGSRRGTRG